MALKIPREPRIKEFVDEKVEKEKEGGGNVVD